MTKILFSILYVTVLSTTIFAQSKLDSNEILTDTINVRGYVFDENNRPFADVKVSTGYIEVKTNSNGFFELKGFTFKSNIFFHCDTLSDILFNNQSRFITHRLVNSANQLSTYDNNIKIQAKRTQEKKTVPLEFIYHPPGFLNNKFPATYPGGIEKFYKHIQDNLIYPKKAIDANIEGIVGIEFNITKTGRLENFQIIKDIDYDCSTALIDVLRKSRLWNPGTSGGKPTVTKFYIEIPFKLID